MEKIKEIMALDNGKTFGSELAVVENIVKYANQCKYSENRTWEQFVNEYAFVV